MDDGAAVIVSLLLTTLVFVLGIAVGMLSNSEAAKHCATFGAFEHNDIVYECHRK